MEKFGAGSHKPGSGSACALTGMVAAKLICTVVNLTNKKPAYNQAMLTLATIKEQISTRIFPRLAELLQEDSDVFDKVIRLRNEQKKNRCEKRTA